MREASPLYVEARERRAFPPQLARKKGAWHLDSSEQMKRRPMLPLLQSLQELGTRVEYQGRRDDFPFTLYPETTGGRILRSILSSSQSIFERAFDCGLLRRTEPGYPVWKEPMVWPT